MSPEAVFIITALYWLPGKEGFRQVKNDTEKVGQESYSKNICSPRSLLAPWNSHAGGLFPAPVINALVHLTKFPSGNKIRLECDLILDYLSPLNNLSFSV